MKISHIQSQILVMPQADPLANTREDPNSARPLVILRMGTDDGIEGIAVTFYGGATTRSLKAAVDDLGALTVGEDPLRVEAIIAKLRAAAGGSGPAGMFTLALAALDIALWDIRGKALSQPLWKLLGGARQRVPAYASGALRRYLSLDEVVTAARRLKDKGFREMKTQLALPEPTSPANEVERMVRVREAIGPDIKLMCDINQRWRVEQAIDIGKRVEDAGVGLFWLEDVTTHDDYAGIARINAALATPICGGELVYGIVPFRHMIEARSVDYVMIDLIRVGGITPWMKVAGMAEAFNLPVVSHVIPEIHAPSRRGGVERADRRIYGLDAGIVRRRRTGRKRRDCSAGPAGSRPYFQPADDRPVCGGLTPLAIIRRPRKSGAQDGRCSAGPRIPLLRE